MKRVAAPAALTLVATLSGCVAAVIPIAAGGVIGKRELAQRRAARGYLAATADPVVSDVADSRITLLPPGSVLPPPGGAPTVTPPVAGTGWRALLRAVATRVAAGDGACGGRSRVVALDAALAGPGATDRDAAVVTLNALRTMGVETIFVGDPAAATSIAQAGFGEGAILPPGDRTAIAGAHCVIASGEADAASASIGDAPRFMLGQAAPAR